MAKLAERRDVTQAQGQSPRACGGPFAEPFQSGAGDAASRAVFQPGFDAGRQRPYGGDVEGEALGEVLGEVLGDMDGLELGEDGLARRVSY